MDRIDLDVPGLTGVYGAMWNWLERRADVKSGWTADRFLGRLADREDQPAASLHIWRNLGRPALRRRAFTSA